MQKRSRIRLPEINNSYRCTQIKELHLNNFVQGSRVENFLVPTLLRGNADLALQ